METFNRFLKVWFILFGIIAGISVTYYAHIPNGAIPAVFCFIGMLFSFAFSMFIDIHR